MIEAGVLGRQRLLQPVESRFQIAVPVAEGKLRSGDDDFRLGNQRDLSFDGSGRRFSQARSGLHHEWRMAYLYRLRVVDNTASNQHAITGLRSQFVFETLQAALGRGADDLVIVTSGIMISWRSLNLFVSFGRSSAGIQG
jgi:hypothetical protein